ncbi:MAG: LamG domain-containing protein [Spirochaetota bacterium]
MKRSIILAALAAATLGAQSPTAGLIARWTFDDTDADKAANTVKDAVGKHHGTLMKGAVFTEGRTLGAVQFNGKESCIEGKTMPSIGQEFSITAWVKSDNLAAGQQSVFSGNTKGSHYLRINQDGTLQLVRAETASVATSNGKIKSGIWQHVAVTYANGKWDFLINGVIAGSGSTAHIDFTVAGKFVVGRLGPAGGIRPMFGAIDDLCVYNRVLGSDELAALAK